MRGLASLPLYGFALVIAFVLLTVDGPLGALLALVWAFVVFPGAAALLTRRRHRRGGPGTDAPYWTTQNWQSGAPPTTTH